MSRPFVSQYEQRSQADHSAVLVGESPSALSFPGPVVRGNKVSMGSSICLIPPDLPATGGELQLERCRQPDGHYHASPYQCRKSRPTVFQFRSLMMRGSTGTVSSRLEVHGQMAPPVSTSARSYLATHSFTNSRPLPKPELSGTTLTTVRPLKTSILPTLTRNHSLSVL